MKNYPKHLAIVIFAIITVGAFLFLLSFFPGYFYLGADKGQQFSELANSFLQGKTHFLESSFFNAPKTDNTPFLGKFYWPLGPFPAFFLAPFVFLGNSFNFYFFQGYLNFLLVAAVAYFIFAIARRLKYSVEDGIFLIAAFIGSSMFLAVAIMSSSWYFAHTVSVFLMFLALFEYFNKKRPLLIGLIFGLILLTRVTAFLGIIFFALDILLEKKGMKEKIYNLLKLAAVPLLCLVILFSYNYARFGNIFDQGYEKQLLGRGFMIDKEDYGLWNVHYFIRGAYYSLLSTPLPIDESITKVSSGFKPNYWGMSIFITSPYLLYFFFAKIRDRKAVLLLLNSVFILAMILPTFFIGYLQFGFRYALDFLPLLFVAFMLTYKKEKGDLSFGLKLTIIISAFFNFYLLCQML